MKTPSSTVLLVARVYFFLVCACLCYELADAAAGFNADNWPRVTSIVDVSLVAYILLMAFAPMVGHFAFAWQRKIGGRMFWQAFFVLDAMVWASGAVMQFLFGLDQDARSAIFEFLIWIPQLVILFAYAYRSPQLWNRQVDARLVPQP